MEILVVSKVVVVAPDGKILLLKRSASDARRPGQWDIPGGHVDAGESPAQAAVRETAEESGIKLQADALQLVFATTHVFSNGLNVSWTFHIASSEQADAALSAEHDDFRWVSLDEAIDLIEYDRQKEVLRHIQDNKLLDLAR